MNLDIFKEIIDIVTPIASIAVAGYSVYYAKKSNTKKFELEDERFKEIHTWYKEVYCILVSIRKNQSTRTEKRSQLSAMIDVGRFYFPNKKEGWSGDGAYDGSRQKVLSYLVKFYEESNKNVDDKKLEELQKSFTKYIFNYLEPRKRYASLSKKSEFGDI